MPFQKLTTRDKNITNVPPKGPRVPPECWKTQLLAHSCAFSARVLSQVKGAAPCCARTLLWVSRYWLTSLDEASEPKPELPEEEPELLEGLEVGGGLALVVVGGAAACVEVVLGGGGGGGATEVVLGSGGGEDVSGLGAGGAEVLGGGGGGGGGVVEVFAASEEELTTLGARLAEGLGALLDGFAEIDDDVEGTTDEVTTSILLLADLSVVTGAGAGVCTVDDTVTLENPGTCDPTAPAGPALDVGVLLALTITFSKFSANRGENIKERDLRWSDATCFGRDGSQIVCGGHHIDDISPRVRAHGVARPAPFRAAVLETGIQAFVALGTRGTCNDIGAKK